MGLRGEEMAKRPPSMCTVPRCPGLAYRGPYCAEHERQLSALYEKVRPKRRRKASIRELRLLNEPLCRSCLSRNRIVPATEVDHIQPLEDGGLDVYENTQSLCSRCHGKKSLRERGWRYVPKPKGGKR